MAQKKRRMLCIVVSRLPAVFQRLMLVEYQIGLNFAPGMGLQDVDDAHIDATKIGKTPHLYSECTDILHQKHIRLYRIRRT